MRDASRAPVTPAPTPTTPAMVAGTTQVRSARTGCGCGVGLGGGGVDAAALVGGCGAGVCSGVGAGVGASDVPSNCRAAGANSARTNG